MYWLVMLDNLSVAGFMILFVSFTATCVLFIGHTVEGWPKWPIIAASCAMLVSMSIITFLPSTKQMAAILIIPKIANSEKVQQTGNHLYDLAVEWMEELQINNIKKGR